MELDELQRGLDKLVIKDKSWVRLYSEEELTHDIHYTELKYIIKALQNVKKWCSVWEEN